MEKTERVVFECVHTSYFMKFKMPDGEMRRIHFAGGIDKGIHGRTNGIYTTVDPEEIEALKKNPNFGKTFSIQKQRKLNEVEVAQHNGRPLPEPKNEAVSTEAPEVPQEEGDILVATEVASIQEAGEFLVENFEVSKNSVSTGAKIQKWLEENPGKGSFPKVPMLHK